MWGNKERRRQEQEKATAQNAQRRKQRVMIGTAAKKQLPLMLAPSMLTPSMLMPPSSASASSSTSAENISQQQYAILPMGVMVSKFTTTKGEINQTTKLEETTIKSHECLVSCPIHNERMSVPVNITTNSKQLKNSEQRMDFGFPVVPILLVLLLVIIFWRRTNNGIAKMSRSSSLNILCHEQHKSLQTAQETIAQLKSDLKKEQQQPNAIKQQPISPERQVEPRGIANEFDDDDTIPDNNDGDNSNGTERQLYTQFQALDVQLREKDSKLEAVQLLLHLKEKSQQESKTIHAQNVELLEQAKAALVVSGKQQYDQEAARQQQNKPNVEQQNDELRAELEQSKSDLVKSNNEHRLELKSTQEELLNEMKAMKCKHQSKLEDSKQILTTTAAVLEQAQSDLAQSKEEHKLELHNTRHEQIEFSKAACETKLEEHANIYAAAAAKLEQSKNDQVKSSKEHKLALQSIQEGQEQIKAIKAGYETRLEQSKQKLEKTTTELEQAKSGLANLAKSKEEHKRELQGTGEKLLKEINAMKVAHQTNLKESKQVLISTTTELEQARSHLSKLKEEHRLELKAIQEELEQLNATKASHQTDLGESKQLLSTAVLEQARNDLVESKEKHKLQEQNIQEELLVQIEAAKTAHQTNLEESMQLLASTTAALEQVKSDLAKSKEDHTLELQNIQAELLEQIESTKITNQSKQEEYGKTLSKTATALELAKSNLAESKEDHTLDLQCMQADVLEQIESTKVAHQAKLEECEQLHATTTAALELARSNLRILKKDHKLELQHTQEELLKEMKSTRATNHTKLKEIEQTLTMTTTALEQAKSNLAKSKEEHKVELQNTQDLLLKDIENAKATHQADIEEFQQILAKTTIDLESKARQLLHQLEERNSSLKQQQTELKRTEADLQATQLDLGEQLANAVEKTQAAETKMEALTAKSDALAAESEQWRLMNTKATQALQQQVLEKSNMLQTLQSSLDTLGSEKQKLGVKFEQVKQGNNAIAEELKQQVEEKTTQIASLQVALHEAKEAGEANELSNNTPSSYAAVEDKDANRLQAEKERLQRVEEQLADETERRQNLESKMQQINKEKDQLAADLKLGQDKNALLVQVERLRIENATVNKTKQQLKKEYNRLKEANAKNTFDGKEREHQNQDLTKRLENESARKLELQSKLESRDRDNRKMKIELGELKAWSQKSNDQTAESSLAGITWGIVDDVERLRHEIAELTASLKATRESEFSLLSERERLVANATNISLLLVENRAKNDHLQMQLDEAEHQHSQRDSYSVHGNNSSVDGHSSFALADSSERNGGGGGGGIFSGSNSNLGLSRSLSGSNRGAPSKARFRTFLQNRVFRDTNPNPDDDDDDDTE